MIVFPEKTAQAILCKCKEYGAKVVLFGEDFAEAKRQAFVLGADLGLVYINGWVIDMSLYFEIQAYIRNILNYIRVHYSTKSEETGEYIKPKSSSPWGSNSCSFAIAWIWMHLWWECRLLICQPSRWKGFGRRVSPGLVIRHHLVSHADNICEFVI